MLCCAGPPEGNQLAQTLISMKMMTTQPGVLPSTLMQNMGYGAMGMGMGAGMGYGSMMGGMGMGGGGGYR